MGVYFAQYGTAWTLQGYKLVDRTTGQYKTAPTLAAGDFKAEKDGGASANLTTLPSVTAGSSVAIPFSAVEMQCKQLVLSVVDQAGAEWNDDCIHIFTVGGASAYFQFDLFTATVGLSVAAASGLTSQVWEELRGNHTSVGTFGEGVASVRGNVTGDVEGNVDGSVGSVTAVSSGAITSASFATDAVTAAAFAADAAQEIADEILNRNLAGGGSGHTRNIRNALRSVRNRVKNQGGTLSVYEEDDTTVAWTAVTTTAASDPVVEFDPS